MFLHGCLSKLLLWPCMAAKPLSHMVLHVNCCYGLSWLLYPCPTWCYMWIAAAIALHGCQIPCPTWRYMWIAAAMALHGCYTPVLHGVTCELLLLWPCMAAKPPVPHGVTCELLLLWPCMAAIPLSHMVLHVKYCCYCLAWLLNLCPTWCYMWIAAVIALNKLSHYLKQAPMV